MHDLATGSIGNGLAEWPGIFPTTLTSGFLKVWRFYFFMPSLGQEWHEKIKSPKNIYIAIDHISLCLGRCP
jgi:hypothetical protein